MLDMFQERVERDLTKLHMEVKQQSHNNTSNLTSQEFHALKAISLNKNRRECRQERCRGCHEHGTIQIFE